MAGINDEKRKLMEAEMNRFEAEIAVPVLPPPPPPAPPRPVIGSNTYRQVQKQLEQQQAVVVSPIPGPMGFQPMMAPMPAGFPGLPPPPPPPPPMLIPHQVQRAHIPVRPMPPPMGMGPGPMMGPPGPGFLGPPMNARPFMAAPMPMEAPIMTTAMAPIPAIVSATPKLYGSKPIGMKMPLEEMVGMLTEVSRVDPHEEAEKRRKMKEKAMDSSKVIDSSRAKEMADKVKASTVILVGPSAGGGGGGGSGGGGGGGGGGGPEEGSTVKKKEKKPKKIIRTAGGQTWEDNSLTDWDDDDFRIFCGDLGNDVTDEVLARAFGKFPSFLKAKVVRDKRTNKTKGYGFVSFKDPQDFIKAMKEMNANCRAGPRISAEEEEENRVVKAQRCQPYMYGRTMQTLVGRYVGSRPIKLRKSSWRSRNIDLVRKKEKEKAALIGLLTGR